MEREAGEEESQRRRCDRIREWSDVTVDFEEGPGAWAKECKHSPQAEKVMKTDYLLELPEKNSILPTSWL